MPGQNKILIKLEDQPDWIGLRLDKALGLHPEIQTRSRATHLIEKQTVLVNGANPKSSLVLKGTDIIEIILPEKTSSELQKYDFPLDIIFEDSDLIVINKPSGLVVHPGAGHQHDTLVNALLNHTSDLSMKFNEERPGIVHRIDRETSGLLVVAKNDFAHEFLASQFKEKTSFRVYQAVAMGRFLKPTGTVESQLGRHPVHRQKMASVDDGKWAQTDYQVLKQKKDFALVQLKLKTGRTHQIRVHLSELGHPLVGDSLYGFDRRRKAFSDHDLKIIDERKRFLLHAEQLGFHHPKTQKWLQFQVQWPDEDLDILKKWDLA